MISYMSSFFNWSPPKLSKFKFILKITSFGKNLKRFARDHIIKKIEGVQLKQIPLVIGVEKEKTNAVQQLSVFSSPKKPVADLPV